MTIAYNLTTSGEALKSSPTFWVFYVGIVLIGLYFIFRMVKK